MTEGILAWETWPLEREGCQNKKDDFLNRHSSLKVTYEKKLNQNCHVVTGKWKDFFTGEEFTDASDAVVTTVVPFQHLRHKGLKDMPPIRISSMNRDEDFFIILKKSGEGYSLYQKNIYAPIEAPRVSMNLCAFYGMWKDMKDKWGIKYRKDEKNLLAEKSAICMEPSSYEREHFKHWSKLPGQNCHTRIESLKRDSVQPLTNKELGNCEDFTGGQWLDLYSGNMIDDHKIIDIDHFVPLMNAFVSGGWKWPWWKKENYANYMKDPLHLVSVSAKENRSKGAKHPGLYMPPLESFQCEYIKQWVAIKFRWNLAFTTDEASALEVYSMKCGFDAKEAMMESVDLLQSGRMSVELKE